VSLEFELGGVKGWAPEGRTTVNIVPPADIVCDIRLLDDYCSDNTVTLFGLNHTLEHIPSQDYVQFLKDMHRKLTPGGCVEVIQTDAGALIRRAVKEVWPLRVLRLPLFSPADRLRENPYHQHFNMWSAELLVDDFELLGYRAEEFDAGYWEFNQRDELKPHITDLFYGVHIPNLGVRAYKEVP
jgi:predicted SAM-dependent methyltransferase